jgi:hypothetical protein
MPKRKFLFTEDQIVQDYLRKTEFLQCRTDGHSMRRIHSGYLSSSDGRTMSKTLACQNEPCEYTRSVVYDARTRKRIGSRGDYGSGSYKSHGARITRSAAEEFELGVQQRNAQARNVVSIRRKNSS